MIMFEFIYDKDNLSLGLGVPKEKTLTAFLANFINMRELLYKNIDGYGRECDLLARYSAMEKDGKVVTDEEWSSLPDDLLKANKALLNHCFSYDCFECNM